MGTTTNYHFPYPELSDSPNVPLVMQLALTAVDSKFALVDTALATGLYTAPTLATASLYANASQFIPHAVWTDANLQVEQVDSLNGHNTDVLTEKYTVPQGGVYMVTASGGFEVNATGDRAMSIRLLKAADSLYHYVAYTSGRPTAAVEWLATAAVICPLNAGDKLSIGFWQNSGGSLWTAGYDNYPARLGLRQLA